VTPYLVLMEEHVMTMVMVIHAHAVKVIRMFAYSDVQHFVLSNVLTFCIPCCDVRYDSHMETMFGSSLPPVVCRRHMRSRLFWG
jgi:hypothetical protein